MREYDVASVLIPVDSQIEVRVVGHEAGGRLDRAIFLAAHVEIDIVEFPISQRSSSVVIGPRVVAVSCAMVCVEARSVAGYTRVEVGTRTAGLDCTARQYLYVVGRLEIGAPGVTPAAVGTHQPEIDCGFVGPVPIVENPSAHRSVRPLQVSKVV